MSPTTDDRTLSLARTNLTQARSALKAATDPRDRRAIQRTIEQIELHLAAAEADAGTGLAASRRHHPANTPVPDGAA